MIKKLVILAILLGLFVTGSLIADEGQVGLNLTVVHEFNSVPYAYQDVEATINGVYQDGTTNNDGLVKFGWKSCEGYYYLVTVIDGVTYYKTVWKPGGQIINVTWVIHVEMHDPE